MKRKSLYFFCRSKQVGFANAFFRCVYKQDLEICNWENVTTFWTAWGTVECRAVTVQGVMRSTLTHTNGLVHVASLFSTSLFHYVHIVQWHFCTIDPLLQFLHYCLNLWGWTGEDLVIGSCPVCMRQGDADFWVQSLPWTSEVCCQPVCPEVGSLWPYFSLTPSEYSSVLSVARNAPVPGWVQIVPTWLMWLWFVILKVKKKDVYK